MKESHNFELAHLMKKKEKKEIHFGCLATFWFAMCFAPLGMLFVIKTFEDMSGRLL